MNRGWYVGMTLLDFERSSIGGAVAQRAQTRATCSTTSQTDEGEEQSQARASLHASALEIADRYIESEVEFNFSFRIVSMQAAA